MIYFDHNATTPLDDRVLEAMLPFLQTHYGNPSSLYRYGRIARTAIDTAREQLAALVDANPSEIVFTSGGTEANNLALASVPLQSKLAISAIEHPSITEPAIRLKNCGVKLRIIPVDSNGVVNDSAVKQLINDKPDLVAMMLANNETGVLLNVAYWSQHLREQGIKLHSDAVQALGKIPLSFKKLGVNSLSLSSHKIYGPKGCGALVIAHGTSLKPLLLGGDQEHALRAGTENVAAIVGFGKAAELAKCELSERGHHTLALRALLEQGLRTLPKLTIFADTSPKLPNTVQFGIDGIDGEMLLMQLDAKGFAVSSGSACASGDREPSPVLLAMGISKSQSETAVRVSLGKTNSEAEVSHFIHVLKSLVNPF